MNNTTVDSSVSCDIRVNSRAIQIGATIAYGLIFVVSLVGNSFLAAIVYKTKAWKRTINFFVLNMAMSDLLYPLLLFPLDLLLFYMDSWPLGGPFGDTLCKLFAFLPSISAVVSIQSLVLIAVDRFGAVVFPLCPPLISSKLCLYFILATWIVAMTVCSPFLIANELVEHQGKRFCVTQWKNTFGEHSSVANYGLALYVVFLYVPVILLTTLYSIILIKLRTQVFPGEQSFNVVKKRMKRNKNVLKMAIAIVLGFVIFWLPYSVIRLLLLFARDSGQQCYILFFWFITNFLAISNCAINPCICFIFCTNFRRRLKILLKCFAASH